MTHVKHTRLDIHNYLSIVHREYICRVVEVCCNQRACLLLIKINDSFNEYQDMPRVIKLFIY
jgi:hypothetical protein